MAVEDDDISALLSEPSLSDVKPVELSSVISTIFSGPVSHKSDQKAPELSLEEAAWVDSCLAHNPELSDDNWSAVREALLDALDAYTASFETHSSDRNSGENEERDDEGVQWSGESEERDDEGVQTIEDGETPAIPLINVKEHTGSEDVQKDEDTNPEDSESFQEDIESRENIFKVWDLEIPSPDEDDEFIQQLNKDILVGSEEGQRLPPVVSTLSQKEIDELVGSFCDLTLQLFEN